MTVKEHPVAPVPVDIRPLIERACDECGYAFVESGDFEQAMLRAIEADRKKRVPAQDDVVAENELLHGFVNGVFAASEGGRNTISLLCELSRLGREAATLVRR